MNYASLTYQEAQLVPYWIQSNNDSVKVKKTTANCCDTMDDENSSCVLSNELQVLNTTCYWCEGGTKLKKEEQPQVPPFDYDQELSWDNTTLIINYDSFRGNTCLYDGVNTWHPQAVHDWIFVSLSSSQHGSYILGKKRIVRG